jgi:hypothetical protein
VGKAAARTAVIAESQHMPKRQQHDKLSAMVSYVLCTDNCSTCGDWPAVHTRRNTAGLQAVQCDAAASFEIVSVLAAAGRTCCITHHQRCLQVVARIWVVWICFVALAVCCGYALAFACQVMLICCAELAAAVSAQPPAHCCCLSPACVPVFDQLTTLI